MAENISQDAQGRCVKIGDVVFSMAKNYRSLIEAKVVDITPKTLVVEYVNSWNYSRGVVERYRVGSDQIMLKLPEDASPVVHAKLSNTGWDEAWCQWGNCSVCGGSNIIGVKYCNDCGARLDLEETPDEESLP